MKNLLEPRYKVIADYPGNAHPVGKIHQHNINGTQNVMPLGEWIEWHNKYPHLFKRLEWWEERKPEEMPEYVKHEGMVVKVDSYVKDVGFNFYYGESAGYGKRAFTKDTLPATKEEYENFIKHNQGEGSSEAGK